MSNTFEAATAELNPLAIGQQLATMRHYTETNERDACRSFGRPNVC
jgi:hypothetical protein